jgi:hypothetical protein
LATTTIGFGVALIILGVGGFLYSGMTAPTALIPAAFGLLLVVFGGMAKNESKRKVAMHIAVTVGLLGFLGTVSGVVDVMKMLSGMVVERPAASVSKSIMALLMAVFVGMCVKSFIDARRARAKA